jgi:hypothetical protein
MHSFVLIHSPLVGPLTWSLVAAELRRRAIEVVTPTLRQWEDSAEPYWQQHARAVASALRVVAPDRAPVLAGHSGAGPLLPAIRREAGRSPPTYSSTRGCRKTARLASAPALSGSPCGTSMRRGSASRTGRTRTCARCCRIRFSAGACSSNCARNRSRFGRSRSQSSPSGQMRPAPTCVFCRTRRTTPPRRRRSSTAGPTQRPLAGTSIC